MILSDCDLRKLIRAKDLVVEPLSDNSIQQNGVDFRISNEIATIKAELNNQVMDSSSIDAVQSFYHVQVTTEGFFVFLPLHHYLLKTQEKVKMPTSLIGFCGLRSTFARLGFVSPLTIVDAGFEGPLTIGVFYGGGIPIKVAVGLRFLHVVFGELKSPAEAPYAGHYKNQPGISVPKSLL
jgi:dCTP deaminase